MEWDWQGKAQVLQRRICPSSTLSYTNYTILKDCDVRLYHKPFKTHKAFIYVSRYALFLPIGLYSVPRFENRRQQNHIFFCFKWHGLPLQWQHCLKEDVHKWTLRCRIVIYPKSLRPEQTNQSISAPPTGRFIGKLYLVRGLLCTHREAAGRGGKFNPVAFLIHPFPVHPFSFLKLSLHIRARYCYRNVASRQSRRNYDIL